MKILKSFSVVIVLGGAFHAEANKCPALPNMATNCDSVTIFIPTKGGIMDQIARDISSLYKGKPTFVVEQKFGAAGLIALQALRSAPKKSCTMMMGSVSFLSLRNLVVEDKLQFHPDRDFTPIGTLVSNPLLLVARKQENGNDMTMDALKQMAAKQNINFGTVGKGTLAHLLGLSLKRQWRNAVHSMQDVSYQGSPEIYNNLMNGDLHFTFRNPADPLDPSRLTVLGSTAAQKIDLEKLKNIQPLGPNFQYMAWIGLAAPARLPQDIQTEMNSIAECAVKSGVLEKYKKDKFQIESGTADDMRSKINQDYARWGPLIKDENLGPGIPSLSNQGKSTTHTN